MSELEPYEEMDFTAHRLLASGWHDYRLSLLTLLVTRLLVVAVVWSVLILSVIFTLWYILFISLAFALFISLELSSFFFKIRQGHYAMDDAFYRR
jgi:hypothetical protein